MDSTHVQIVRDSLAGRHHIDEQTSDSMAVLSECLQRLNKLGGKFAKIDFSPQAKNLRRTQKALAVG